MYCWNCGKELDNDTKFCSRCGVKVNSEVDTYQETVNVVANESKRTVINVPINYTTKNKDVKTNNETNKNLLLLGTVLLALFLLAFVIIIKGTNNDKRIYKAYAKFYHEFYDEHVNEGSEEAVADCGGQILIDKAGKPLLAICDITSMENSINVDVYLYEYKMGKVREIARKTGIKTSDDGLYIGTYDDKITMCTSEYDNEEAVVYVLGKNGFETETTFREEYEDRNEYVDFWINTLGYSDDVLYVAFFSDINDTYAINGSNFELLLSQLVQKKPDTTLELKRTYSEFFDEESIYDNTTFVYVEENRVYCYVLEDNKLIYMGKIGESDVDDISKNVPKKIEGVSVEISDDLKDYKASKNNGVDSDSDKKAEEKININMDSLIKSFEYNISTNYGNIEAKYVLVSIDDDSIPELLVESDSFDFDYLLLAMDTKDNVIKMQPLVLQQGDRLAYVENENKVIMGNDLFNLCGFWQSFSLKDSILEEENIIQYNIDNDGSSIYLFNDTEISEDEYWNKFFELVEPSKKTDVADLMKFSSIQDAYDYYKGTFSATYSGVGYAMYDFRVENGILETGTLFSFDDNNTNWIRFEVSPNCEWYRYYTSGERGDNASYEIFKEEIWTDFSSYNADRENYITDSATSYAIEIKDNVVVAIYSINS